MRKPRDELPPPHHPPANMEKPPVKHPIRYPESWGEWARKMNKEKGL